MISQHFEVGQASEIELALLNGPLYSHAFEFHCRIALLSRRERAGAALNEEVLSPFMLHEGESQSV